MSLSAQSRQGGWLEKGAVIADASVGRIERLINSNNFIKEKTDNKRLYEICTI